MKSLFTLILLSITIIANAQYIQSNDEWEKRFDLNWNKEYRIAIPKSTSSDSWDLYNLAYYIDANVTMFEVTNDKKYLDKAIEYTQNVISSAKVSKELKNSQFKDNFLGWENLKAPSYKNDGKEYPLFESYLWRYVTGILVNIKTENLIENYRKDYQSILDFTIVNIYDKWSSRGQNNIYRSNAHMSSHWAKICADLYLITNDEKYKKVVNNFLDKFTQQIEYRTNPKNNEKRLVWKSKWGNSSKKYQDLSHGNAVVSLLVYLHEKKLGVTDEHIQGLVNLTKSFFDSKKFPKYVDGTGKGTGWLSDGFIMLGRYDKSLQAKLENHKVGRSTQFYAHLAKNAKILAQSEDK